MSAPKDEFGANTAAKWWCIQYENAIARARKAEAERDAARAALKEIAAHPTQLEILTEDIETDDVALPSYSQLILIARSALPDHQTEGE